MSQSHRSVASSAARSKYSTREAPKAAPVPAPAPKPWYSLSSSERDILALSTGFKVLLYPAYRSTDFEVHRNWLAITHSLPLSKWYYDTTSEWTLDYPPFFAYFERFLSFFAYIVDPAIVALDNLNHDSWSAIAFQRSTVIASELVLATAAIAWARRSKKPDYPTALVIVASIMMHPGLIIVDHIHFQYNGFLLGILLWSIIAARENHLYTTAALFAALLNFKHIFIYMAPPYFVFLLRRHCFREGKFHSDRLVELGALVVSIFALSFGPFLLASGPSGIQQIVSRLFPFQRGLNHAYWAPNVWALVSGVDRVLVRYLVSRGWPISPDALTSSSRGLIGSTTFGVLPAITPSMCFSLTLGFSCVYLTKLWFDPTYKRFVQSIVLSAMTSFLWGWHVHEKAVLLFLVPLSLLAVEDEHHLRAFIVASTAGIFALFPLLIKSAESPVKILVSLIWSAVVFPSLRKVVYRPLPTLFSLLVNYGEGFYLAGFLALQFYVSVVHEWIFPGPIPDYGHHVTESLVEKVLNSTLHCVSNGGGDGSGVEAVMSDVPAQCSVVAQQLASSATDQANKVAATAMEFLPLMLTSMYCSLGIIWAWLRLSWAYMTG